MTRGVVLGGGHLQQADNVGPALAVRAHLDEEPYRAMLATLRLDE